MRGGYSGTPWGLLAAGLLALLLAACAAPATPAPALLRVRATDMAYPLLLDLAAAYREVSPSVRVEVELVSRSTLEANLAEGRADLGLAAAASASFATPLGYAPLAFVVHPGNPLDSLSLAQIREIFAGRVTDWAQVGGAPGDVQALGREAGSDAEAAWGADALAGVRLASTALVAPSWQAVREYVGQNPAAIGYLPASELAAEVKPLAVAGDLRVLVAALAPAEPAGPARDFLAWAQGPDGQRAVARRYAPLP